MDSLSNAYVTWQENTVLSESSRQPPDVSKNIDDSFLNSQPQCFECDIPILSKNVSANISQKEKDVSIDLNKKINDQLIEIRKFRHQEYISSNCNAAIDDVNKDIQIGNYDTDKKNNSHEVVDSTHLKPKQKL